MNYYMEFYECIIVMCNPPGGVWGTYTYMIGKFYNGLINVS